jgi:hypothetical protein
MFLVWKVMWIFGKNVYPCYKSPRNLWPTKMHDFTNGDDNNDDPPLAKILKFELPSIP